MSQEFSTNLGLDAVPILQEGEALSDLYRLYNAVKILAIALDSAAGIIGKPKTDWSFAGNSALRLQNLTRVYYLFSETVPAGNLVSFWNNAGTTNVRKAGGAALIGGLAHGFVLGDVLAGEYGEVFLGGVNSAIAGLTPGVTYDLSTTTAGLITASASSPNKQTVGFALTANSLWFSPTLFAR